MLLLRIGGQSAHIGGIDVPDHVRVVRRAHLLTICRDVLQLVNHLLGSLLANQWEITKAAMPHRRLEACHRRAQLVGNPIRYLYGGILLSLLLAITGKPLLLLLLLVFLALRLLVFLALPLLVFLAFFFFLRLLVELDSLELDDDVSDGTDAVSRPAAADEAAPSSGVGFNRLADDFFASSTFSRPWPLTPRLPAE